MKRWENQIEKPLVSVIVPNFNHARFLKERLQSIFNQTFQEFEVILLDDCSTDESREVLTSFEKHPLVTHCVFNEFNSGSTFRQWEKGLNLAKGEWIWIAESDDSADTKFLENLIHLAQSADLVSLAFSRSQIIDDAGVSKGLYRWAEVLTPNRWNTNFVNAGKSECEQFLIHRNTIPNASAVLFRKSVALEVIHHVQQFKYCGDWLFWAKMAYAGKVAYCAEAVNFFRRYPRATSLVRTEEKLVHRVKEYMRVISEISSFPGFNPPQVFEHQWIIDEWMNNRKSLSLLRFVQPPFSQRLKRQFYQQLFRRLISK